ncbi:MAG: hypothetical protein O7F71_16860 [Gammaproteobacteria bacterium]|nr:hypothetical protein [Gammaproteobacteria bacterium]
MPIQLIYEPDGASVVVKGSGIIDATEIQRCNDQIYAPDRIHKLRSQLCDFCDVTTLNLSSDDMWLLAAQDRAAAAQNPNLAIAIVGNDDLMFGLAKMWEVFVTDASLKANVFRTLKEARGWLEEQAQRKPPKQAPQAETADSESSSEKRSSD